jgi:hypothetical protein
VAGESHSANSSSAAGADAIRVAEALPLLGGSSSARASSAAFSAASSHPGLVGLQCHAKSIVAMRPMAAAQSFLRGGAVGAKNTPPSNDAEDTNNEFFAQ